MFDAIGDFFSTILSPLIYITSLILDLWHELFSLVFSPDSGAAWTLSIIGLTVTIRAALIPLFVKQIKSSRNMQLLQPKVRELQKKYGHDRERLAQETMALYKDTGTNPFASCLPLLLQMPIFFALFSVINKASNNEAVGALDAEKAASLSQAKVLGALISDSFTRSDDVSVKILAAVLVLAMTATTFLTQRQLMSKNMPADALTGPYAQQQKMLLYVLPLVFAVGGIAFPIGVLIYWTTSNLWTMGQQFYVIRNNPAPGTPAFTAKEDRDRKKAAKKGLPDPVAEAPAVEKDPGPTAPRRQQPKKQTREQRKKQQPKPGETGPTRGEA